MDACMDAFLEAPPPVVPNPTKKNQICLLYNSKVQLGHYKKRNLDLSIIIMICFMTASSTHAVLKGAFFDLKV